MAVYKIENCSVCRIKYHVEEAKKNRPCPKCGVPMIFSRCWYISYTHEGKFYRERVSPDHKDAVNRQKEVDAQRGKGTFEKAPSTPWTLAVKEFDIWVTANVKPKTQEMYRNSIHALSEYFSTYRLDKLRPDQVEKYKLWREVHRHRGYGHETEKDTVSKATINRDLATLKRFINVSIDSGKLFRSKDTDAILRVKLHREEARVRYLTEEEQARLLQECEGRPRLKLAILIALNTGLRADGVKRMKRTDIDLKLNRIHRKGKRDKDVYIPITDTLRRALLDYPVMGEYLFPSMTPRGQVIRQGEPIHADADMGFSKACARAGITDFHFHDLRHTFASWFLMRTNDLTTLQELLGHADISTTRKYVHLSDAHKHSAMQIFDKGGEQA